MDDRAVSRSAAPAAARHVDQVRMLFDSKADGWPGKYAADGRLAGRLTQLAAATADLTAAGGELLDLGCGSGELARHLAGAGYQVTGCDISARMLDQAAAADPGHAVRWIRLEPGWSVLPFAAASLDTVIAASILEYVPLPAGVLAECARILRPGGVLLCTVPRVAHPVRWLEWAFRLAATTPLAGLGAAAGFRSAQYLAYLRASRQRHWVRWWRAAARQTGLEPASGRPAGCGPLRLLAFTRSAEPAGRLAGPPGGRR